MALAADLPVEAAIGLEKALVAQRTVQENLAIRANLGGGDHRGQHIFQLVVEIAGHRIVENPVQSQATAKQQDDDPRCGNADHPPAKRAGGLCA